MIMDSLSRMPSSDTVRMYSSLHTDTADLCQCMAACGSAVSRQKWDTQV